MSTFVCAGCDAEDDADTLPNGWAEEHSSIGPLARCPKCVEKAAPRILSQRLAAGDEGPSVASDDVITGAAQGRLRTIIERIERLLEDRAEVSADITEVYSEAKGEGFDVKILRKVVRLRAMDATTRSEETALIDLYLSAIEG